MPYQYIKTWLLFRSLNTEVHFFEEKKILMYGHSPW